MRTGTAPPPPTGGSYSPVAPFVQPGAPKTRRQPALLALGIALIGVSAAGFVYWNQQAEVKSSVLVLTRDVPYGQQLTAGDLTTVQMTLPAGVHAIGSASEGAVLADVATTQLYAGGLLSAAEIGPVPPIPTGMDVLAISLSAAQLPDGLEPGRHIMLVDNTPPPAEAKPASGAATPAPAAIPTYPATIVAISGTKLTLAVAHAQAPLIEQLADGGKFGITIPPAGS